MKMRAKDLLGDFFEAAFGSFANKRDWCESLHRATLLTVSACRRVLTDGMHKGYWFDWSPNLEKGNCGPNQCQCVSNSAFSHMGHD